MWCGYCEMNINLIELNINLIVTLKEPRSKSCTIMNIVAKYCVNVEMCQHSRKFNKPWKWGKQIVSKTFIFSYSKCFEDWLVSSPILLPFFHPGQNGCDGKIETKIGAHFFLMMYHDNICGYVTTRFLTFGECNSR